MMEDPDGKEEACSRAGLLLVCTSLWKALVTMGHRQYDRHLTVGIHPHTPSVLGRILV